MLKRNTRSKHYVLSIIIQSDRDSSISSRCSLLLHNILLYASNFTYSYKPKLPSRIEDVVLGLFSTIEDSGVKRLLVYGRLEDRKRYIDTLNYLAKLNEHSILSSDIVLAVERPLIEAYHPRYISWAHTSLKKNTPIALYEHVKNHVDEETTISINPYLYSRRCLESYVNILVENLIPLTLVSLHSGIHRYKQAINQVVFQTLTYYMGLLLNSCRSEECRRNLQILQRLLKYTLLLQSVIVADTYIWIPYMWSLKVGAFPTEFLYSIASQPLSKLVDQVRYTICSERGNVACVFSKVQKTYLNYALEELNPQKLSGEYSTTDIIGKVEGVIRNTISKTLNYRLESETLIGRLKGLSSRLRERSSRKYSSLLLLATEQTSILLLSVLSEIMGVREFYILYTPQTLYQILLLTTLGLKSGICKTILHSNIQLHYIPIPSSEPYICESILENILKNIDSENTFFLLQGPATVTTPLYLKLLKHNIREENILLY